ncbi:potassium/sodium hyperpolarization-activated cyclic nucleotide-gated channel 1-like [Hydractinia symbiolongicarpus]|uniref:potassium/sodium hyperpolarization-activated cyclic nucleotide-gated channel 1-like n=1 Tax=Hydractinia symbiolongicarpus TaxID=13093 RepID=UPI00254AD08B|nr:potassium/sodium hyperpolarization-activated cyclic nucleotide-gated channel 1-like [Hydractinia symbiolongicarpus]
MFQKASADCVISNYHRALNITCDGGIKLNQKLPSTDEVLSHPKLASIIFSHRNKQRIMNRIHNLKDTTKKLRVHITPTDVIKELLCPAETSFNVKICGGKRGFDVERERSKSSGYVIHPCSKIRQYWDLVIMVMLILNMFFLPLDIAFFANNYDFAWMVFHVTSDTLCLVDILLNFRTAYRVNNKELKHFELDHKKIAKHYLKTWFTLDLISSLPIHYIILISSRHTDNLSLGLKGASRALKILRVVKILNLLKLLRLSRIIRGITQYEEAYCLTFGLLRYIKLISMMLIVAHWNGCLHFMLPMLQEFPPNCWVKLSKLENEAWYVQYGWALFKTLSHMLCIGYGRFIPELLSEAIATIFTMVTGATFYALFIAHSMAYVIQSDLSNNVYQEKLNELNDYMVYRFLPDETRKRVSEYFEHKHQRGKFFKDEDILAEMSKPLRDEILNHICADFVKGLTILQTAPEPFISSFLSKLKYEVYLNTDTIFEEETPSDEMFFIRKGTLRLTFQKTLIENLYTGSFCGELSILSRSRRLLTATATSTCDVLVLSRQHMSELLEEYEEMKPVFEHTAISRIIAICRQSGFLSLSTTRHLMILDNHRSLLTQLCRHIRQIKDAVGDDNMLKEKDAVGITAALNMLIDEHMKLHSGCSFLKLFPKPEHFASQLSCFIWSIKKRSQRRINADFAFTIIMPGVEFIRVKLLA